MPSAELSPAVDGTQERLDVVIGLLRRIADQTAPVDLETIPGVVELREPAPRPKPARRAG